MPGAGGGSKIARHMAPWKGRAYRGDVGIDCKIGCQRVYQRFDGDASLGWRVIRVYIVCSVMVILKASSCSTQNV